MFDDDDDECLPIPRRSLIHHQYRKQISPNNERQSCISLNNSINLDESIPTPKQLIDLYEKTIDLASKNQINIRNAFQIPLVERLPEVLNLVAFDDQSHSDPNFIKVGSIIDTSAKIYGLRVDALHSETQRLSGSIQIHTEEEEEEEEEKKPIKKPNHHINKIKRNSFLVSDLSTISISNEFQFHPLQSSNMCQWSGGIGSDTIYADMVSYTMYSSCDFPLVHGFIDLNSRINCEPIENDRLLEVTMKTMIDLSSLREVIKENEGENHNLGCQNLREFGFNEESTESYIETIDERSLIDSSNQDEPEDEDQYAISDLRDEPISFYHPDIQSTYTCLLTMPSIDVSRFSFVDQVPFLLREKAKPSDYTYFDSTKLRLFAGPYVWKYTNLLPDLIKSSIVVRQQQSTKSSRQFRIDFFAGQTFDKLMSLNTRSRQINKKFKQTTASHQLRLTRRVLSQNELIELNQFSNIIFDDNEMDVEQDVDNYIPDVVDQQPFEYDFIRPVHYEKIECEKSMARIDTKKLQHCLFHEYEEEKHSSTISFSNLCLNLIEKQQLSHDKTELISAFYCMLTNCHKNNLFMKSNFQQDDLIIRNQPFPTQTSQLTYAHRISNK